MALIGGAGENRRTEKQKKRPQETTIKPANLQAAAPSYTVPQLQESTLTAKKSAYPVQSQVQATASPVQSQVQQLTETVTGKPWSYDLNADMLYQQYRDQYMQNGRQAMMDTTGQIAQGLTGGYGSSYAATAGNQAYQQYLTQLNSMIPEFYDRAYQRHENDRQYAYQTAMSMLQMGQMPSAEILTAAGIPPADAQAMFEYYQPKPTGVAASTTQAAAPVSSTVPSTTSSAVPSTTSSTVSPEVLAQMAKVAQAQTASVSRQASTAAKPASTTPTWQTGVGSPSQIRPIGMTEALKSTVYSLLDPKRRTK